MKAEGNLLKMSTRHPERVDYYLNIGDEQVYVNDLIGHQLTLAWEHQINCIRCGRKTSKSFFQGYCYPCFLKAPETAPCIVHPEQCQAQEGIARDMEWSKTHCLIDHYVYLAVSSGLKVGVTRHTQIPTRWIDQGASYAIKIAKTPNRYTAGLLEVDLKRHFADKTNWRNMLSNKIDTHIDLLEQKRKAKDSVKKEFAEYFIDDNEIVEINYPVKEYPAKVKSLTFDKENQISGKLVGIKGQYLIFDQGQVLNIRKHNGYVVELMIK